MNTIREVMTPNPAYCTYDATLQEVAQKMIDEDTGFIPLLKENRICGVITDRDIVVRAIAKGLDPTRTQAGDYATTDWECVSPDASIEDAIKQMETRQIRRLLVMEQSCPIGVVSLGDLAECMPHEAEEVLIEVSKSPKTLAHREQA